MAVYGIGASFNHGDHVALPTEQRIERMNLVEMIRRFGMNAILSRVVVWHEKCRVALRCLRQIYENLISGSIDATEWVGPWNDEIMKFYEAAKFYYYPGMHEPGAMLACGMNKTWWDGLSKSDQMMIEAASSMENDVMMSEYNYKNDGTTPSARPSVANTRARHCFLVSASGPKLWPYVCAVIKLNINMAVAYIYI